jgi:hypothetical protein
MFRYEFGGVVTYDANARMVKTTCQEIDQQLPFQEVIEENFNSNTTTASNQKSYDCDISMTDDERISRRD